MLPALAILSALVAGLDRPGPDRRSTVVGGTASAQHRMLDTLSAQHSTNLP